MDSVPGIGSKLIPSLVGPLVQIKDTRPCPAYFEVTLLEDRSTSEALPLSAFVFQNYYCGYISIKQRKKLNANIVLSDGVGIESDEWTTVLSKLQLMRDPHREDDAQDWHTVPVSALQSYDPTSRMPFRIYLHQPSPMWSKVELRHFKCVSPSTVGSQAAPKRLETPRPKSPTGGYTLQQANPDPRQAAALCSLMAEELRVFRVGSR